MINKRNHLIIICLINNILIISACSPLWGSSAILQRDNIPTYTQLVKETTLTSEISTSETEATLEKSPTPLQVSYTNPISTTTIQSDKKILYYSQSGDSLDAISLRFSVEKTNIQSNSIINTEGLIDPGTIMTIPDSIQQIKTPSIQIMPDSEVVFSQSSLDFDINQYELDPNSYLANHKEYLGSTGMTSGINAIERIAIENSFNPRLLIALLEFQSGWVTGQPSNLQKIDYPLEYVNLNYKGLFRQLMLASEDLSLGYFGWRNGSLTELTFKDGEQIRISPELNAGTVALLYYFSKHYNYTEWLTIIDPNIGFLKLFKDMFGDPWIRAQKVEPLFPPNIEQPNLSLPFYPGEIWSLTGGPHSAWEKQGALAALDFAPGADQKGCYDSESWVLASAAGQVVRSGNGVVVIDLDNDGYEQTGWNLLYLHINSKDRVVVGTWLDKDDRIGHPSCEGGPSTGTHVHFARKYNGEWILADGPLPMILSGWRANNGSKPYEGTLTKDNLVVIARTNGTAVTKIIRLTGE